MRYFQLILKDIFAKSPQSLKPLLIILMLPNDIDGVALTQSNLVEQNIIYSITACISNRWKVIFLLCDTLAWNEYLNLIYLDDFNVPDTENICCSYTTNTEPFTNFHHR